MVEQPKQTEGLLYGTAGTDWQERINFARMREERAEKLRQAMKKNNVAVCLLGRPDCVRYATGIAAFAPYAPMLTYTLFSVEHDPVVWEHPGIFQQERDQVPWIKPENFRCADMMFRAGPAAAVQEFNNVFASHIKEQLEEYHLLGEKLGIIGFDGSAIAALNELGIETFDMQLLMMETRAVKTKDEINCWKMAAALSTNAWYAAYEAIRPGVTEKQVEGACLKAVMDVGMDDPAEVSVWSGPITFERGWPNSDRIIQPGDMVFLDFHNMAWMGYHVCHYRNFIVGRKPNAKEKEWMKKVLEKQNRAIAELKPGASTADVVKHFYPASHWGYPEEVWSVDFGHGLGLSGYEIPILSRVTTLKYPVEVKAGMCIAVETIEGEWRVGGVRIEDMVVVTETGAESVVTWPRDEIVVTPRIYDLD